MQQNGRLDIYKSRKLDNSHEPHADNNNNDDDDDDDDDDDVNPSRTLYMLIPPLLLFAAHWSFFVPYTLPFNPMTQRHEESDVGTRVHVSGDRLKGFKLEIIRKYDFRKDHGVTYSRRFPVGLVAFKHLRQIDFLEDDKDAAEQRIKTKDENEGGGFVDNRPSNAFEQVCIGVEAPGPSLKPISANGDDLYFKPGKRVRSEVRDCQWWASQVVQTLCQEGILKPLSSGPSDEELTTPIDIVARLPKH